MSVPEPKKEIILKKEVSTKPYNLSALKKMADHDDDFINHTIGIFIKNSEEAVLNFRKLLEQENWKQIGETAHKILPSYRHLEAETVIPDLVEIKTRTLINNDNAGVEQLVRDVMVKINNLLISIKEDTTIQPG